jgi:hypothetical protein
MIKCKKENKKHKKQNKQTQTKHDFSAQHLMKIMDIK